MESWLPFLDDRAAVSCPICSPAGAQVVLVEPRRIRDRGVQLLDEEAALAETLAATWGAKEADDESFPRLHVPFERLLSTTAGRCHGSLPAVAEGAVDGCADGAALRSGGRRPARLATGVTGLVGQGLLGDAVCRHRGGSGTALRGAGGRGCARASRRRSARHGGGHASWRRRSPVASSCPTPRSPSSPRPTSRAGACRTAGRARWRAPPTASSTTSRPGASSCTASTAWRASRG